MKLPRRYIKSQTIIMIKAQRFNFFQILNNYLITSSMLQVNSCIESYISKVSIFPQEKKYFAVKRQIEVKDRHTVTGDVLFLYYI